MRTSGQAGRRGVRAQGLFFRVIEVELAAHEVDERMPSFISLIFKRKINWSLSLPCPAASTPEMRLFKIGALLVPSSPKARHGRVRFGFANWRERALVRST